MRKSHSCSSRPSPQSSLGLMPFPEQHPSLQGKGESREILPELQGVPAEVVLEEGISCLGVFKCPSTPEGSGVWNWWTQKFVEQLDKLTLLLNSIINSVTYRVQHKLQAASPQSVSGKQSDGSVRSRPGQSCAISNVWSLLCSYHLLFTLFFSLLNICFARIRC